MINALKQLLARIETWPAEDQQGLLEAARSVEAERSGVYHASPQELAAIDRGLDDARNGRFAGELAVDAVRAKFRMG
jgi:predicted transcriptional regulator